MKKAKVLALVLAAALMLSGIGYALWSDSIVLKSTASSGNIDVDFVEASSCKYPKEGRAEAEVDELTRMDGGEGFDKYLDFDPPDKPEDDFEDWNDAEFTEDEIYFTVSNIYPKAQYELKYKVKNNGTVPVKFKGQEVAFVDNGGSWNLFTELKDNISTPGKNVVIIDVGEEAELVTTFKAPNWIDHQFENQWCTYKITLNWEQVEVKLASSLSNPA